MSVSCAEVKEYKTWFLDHFNPRNGLPETEGEDNVRKKSTVVAA
jgi:hypothetical protein